MKDATPKTIHLKDYQISDYTITDVDLTFDLHDTKTKVKSVMNVKRQNSKAKNLVLNGEELVLETITLNGTKLSSSDYEEKDNFLTIFNAPESFTLEIENEINPTTNTALDGLYKSGTIFCSQNEPEGFRRITYFLDRPDVMAKYNTKVIADKSLFPTLLSNGNPSGEGDLEDGRHWASWNDPFPKPSYLYALVAGDLGLVTDSYKTGSGRDIELRIYCDKGNESKCGHAMESLKASMKWEEDVYGLEYDLEIYMIVAVDSFNMGAMENKGLNIFNSAYVLANRETATDDNFLGIEGVIAHEYFHNWSGNRVTCRDWFQLTLKEGLTVFRDQEFSADMNSRPVQRISDVGRLRGHQFVEDAGPTSHPIKPQDYIEINNFYTATIYEKGAEVIRMIHTLLGKEGFRKGTDLYFSRHDGQAVTTEDFLNAMSEANGNYDFTQFKNWYSQSGTPEVTVEKSYDDASNSLSLTIKQSCPDTPGQKDKKPFFFPFHLGILDSKGKDLTLKLKSGSENHPQLKSGILHLSMKEETFVFENINETPFLSLNRDFAAPIKVHSPQENTELAFLLGHDENSFNRFEAGQKLATRLITGLLKDHHAKKELTLDEGYIEAIGMLLDDNQLDSSIKALSLALPAENLLHQEQNPIDFDATTTVRNFVVTTLARCHREKLERIYGELSNASEFKLDPKSMGERDLRNTCLGFLSKLKDNKAIKLCKEQFDNATNMTDEIYSLGCLSKIDCSEKSEASQKFYKKWKHETLVIQKWLSVEAGSSVGNALERVKELENDEVYDKEVPNLFRALIGGFTGNTAAFHKADGSGYAYIADKIIELDAINPQIASRVSNTFKDYKRLLPGNQEKMKVELERILAKKDLSNNVFEIIEKITNG